MTAPVEAVLCRATMNYLSPTVGGAGQPTEVAIRDGRAAALPGWEECGFQRCDHEASVSDWDDDARIGAVHHREMEQLAREMTGADAALVSGHIRRNPQQAAIHQDLAPITFVHSDFADSYGEQLLRRYLDPTAGEAAALEAAGLTGPEAVAARRLVILQFWRNVGPARMDLPLAWCDARTVPRAQVRPIPVTNYAGGGVDFEALGVLAPTTPDDHRWYAFDALEVTEAVAFRTYDSDRVRTGEPYWTPHSAFPDPAVARGCPSRSSIELRATCLWL